MSVNFKPVLAKGPLVSICIPAFNSAKYLKETIESALNQSYSNVEVIVVDDGSQDVTTEVAVRVRDPRFVFIEQTNRGASAARNHAFKRSKGEFVKFLDADDLLNVDCIEAQVSRLNHSPHCIASARWGRFYNNDETTFKLSPEKVWRDMNAVDWLIESLIDSGGNMMQPGLFLIPRGIIEKAGLWNEELNLIDDFEFMCRILTISEKVVFCEGAVLKYRSGNAGSLSSKKKATHMESALKSLELGLEKLLKAENSKRARLAAANCFQRWAYQFYPEHVELFRKAERYAKNLGGSTVKVEGGRLTKTLSKIVGWKKAVLVARQFNRHYT